MGSEVALVVMLASKIDQDANRRSPAVPLSELYDLLGELLKQDALRGDLDSLNDRSEVKPPHQP